MPMPNKILRSLPTLTFVRVLADSVLQRENKLTRAPAFRATMLEGSPYLLHGLRMEERHEG